MDARETTKFVTDKAVALIKALHNPPIGAKEFSGGWCPERCDAVMFTSNASFVIETKISRSDFLADFKKSHRQEGCGIGNYRYYACPTGLIKPEELPPKWGLIYVDTEKKNARATMPVGYGGTIRTPSKDYKHPEHGWTVQTYESFGSKTPKEVNDLPYEGEWRKHPERVEIKFKFENSEFERNFLFALATRYKSQKFMETIL